MWSKFIIVIILEPVLMYCEPERVCGVCSTYALPVTACSFIITAGDKVFS